MNKKSVAFLSIVTVIYIIVWAPMAYSAINLWTDMLFGDFLKSSSTFALYWSYAFFGIVFLFVMVVPGICLYFMVIDENKETSNKIAIR